MLADTPSDLASRIAALQAEFDRVGDSDALRLRLIGMIRELLLRDEDHALLHQTAAAIDGFFALRPAPPLPAQRQFCREVLGLTMAKRPPRAEFVDPADEFSPSPPPPSHFDNFADLLAAALVYRIRQVTTFFHRRNPKLLRETPPPFLLSPQFDERLATVIVEHVAPAMMRVPRFVSQCEHGRKWAGVDAKEFWAIMAEATAMEDRLLATWRAVWSDLKPSRAKDGRLVASPALARIREILAPGEPPAYTLPRIGDDVINLLVRLLSDLRDDLERQWSALAQTCEQEVNRRPEVAAEAIADYFQSLPGRLGEFIVILCHYNTREVTIAFLEQVADASVGTLYLPGFLGRRPGKA